MKKLLTIMMALVMMLTLSQCKKQNEENEDNTAKVRISCTIPINKDSKTDFTNILNGEVNWSAEPEKIYLALPYAEDNHQIVELTSVAHEGTPSTLTFEGYVEQNLLQNGIHGIWYMGRSSILTEGKVTGSIAEQSGSKDDLGYHHIAKASVNINVDNGITMTFKGKFESLMAIAHLDLTNVAGLSGEAIVGTDYSLEYIDGVYRFNVTGNKSIKITGSENKNESYVVLFPTDKNAKDVELNSDSNKKITFRNGIQQNTLYIEKDNKPLIWELPEHECVDLGLPSKVKWATCNIGANSPEAYGDYFAWGEIETKDEYEENNSRTYNKRMNDISGHEIYDAAAANWGEDWRIPTKAECEELMNEEYCTWEWRSNNDFAGYKVTSKINGNYIFLPAAGYKSGISADVIDGKVYGTYSCSTPAERDEVAEKSYTLGFKDETKAIGRIYRENGRVVRPVTGGKFESPAAQYAEVTTAEVSGKTLSTAVCGGNVIVDKYSVVRERGVCYSTSQNPTISDNIKSATPAPGEYTVELTGLQMNTTYYVRAYATTDAGISYGEVNRFETANIGVITSDVTNVTISTAVCGGEVIANSGDVIIIRGIYWGTSADDINNPMMYIDDGTDEYTVRLTGLKPNTTYYVKACANINNNVYYGEVKSFTTPDYEYVDLGLPSGTLWATHNVGATSPTGKGNYYAWGATEVGGAPNYDIQYGGDGDISGNPQYDAAAANWGNGWRMPNKDEYQELIDNCNWEWTEVNAQTKVYGYRVTSKNNRNSIFIPQVNNSGPNYYWTSLASLDGKAVVFKFTSDNQKDFYTFHDRANTCAIRPVKN